MKSNGKGFKLGDFAYSELEIEKKRFDEQYSSLELIQDNKFPFDLKKCDIFSLGIILFELMTSIFNFLKIKKKREINLEKNLPKKFSYYEWMRLRTEGNKKILDKYWNFSNSLREIVYKMMNPDPAIRPNIEDILSLNAQEAIGISSLYFKDEIRDEERKIKEIKEKLERIQGKEKKKRKASIS